jgi:hypothetical protein
LLAFWAFGLILGFGLLQWSLGTAVHTSADESVDLANYWYLSGTTFFTLGYGDITPASKVGRVLAVVEAGLGFGFMAVIIGYLPVLYQAFSRREVTISLLDARAGSPPAAAQFFLRLAQARQLGALELFLAEWERWSAELLESMLSFPILVFYRSQHDNQSWLATLTVILDTTAILMAAIRCKSQYHAQLTFAMARHAAVDISQVLKIRGPVATLEDRLPDARWRVLEELLRGFGLEVQEGANLRISEFRAMYEPFVHSLAGYFLLTLPPFMPEKVTADNWQTSPWMGRLPGIGGLPITEAGGEHA